jgi:hypothetical protein
MALIGLRFYGHAAEMALPPTVPQHSHDLCWSFPRETAVVTKGSPFETKLRGKFATLAVRLAKPIFVHGVVIEHPPKEILNRLDSAIKKF